MVEYIVYICVTILVLYIYFTKTYPSNAGIFINKTLLSGKTKKTVKADKMPNPMHMNSTLNIWMKYNDTFNFSSIFKLFFLRLNIIV